MGFVVIYDLTIDGYEPMNIDMVYTTAIAGHGTTIDHMNSSTRRVQRQHFEDSLSASQVPICCRGNFRLLCIVTLFSFFYVNL